jgi:tetratricopeptide (TPR) repeat protein
MNRQAVQDVTALRLEAKSLRRDAQKKGLDEGTRARFLEDAETALTTAISTLKRELRIAGKQSLTESERSELRELLSSTIGSLGGTYRDAKDYDRAIKAYEEGNTIEEARRKEDGHLDSYNLVQRLVVRLLKDPTLLDDPAFKTQLEAVERELDRQHGLGRHDSWFLADVILVKFLRGKPAEDIFSALESKEADASFYESTDQVIGPLLDEGLGKGSSLEAKLLGFRHMLQRRGGLKPSS